MVEENNGPREGEQLEGKRETGREPVKAEPSADAEAESAKAAKAAEPEPVSRSAAGPEPAPETEPPSREVDESSGTPAGPSREESEPSGAEAEPPKPKKKQVPKRKVDPTLARAYRARRPVEGTVTEVIKGGFQVQVGKSRAFCPFSQIDMHRSGDPEVHRGKTYRFRIIQFRRGGDDVVLSRRALLEEETAEEAKAVRATLIEGALTQGHVAGISDFGVFVDLGAGVQGLVHISELSHSKVADPHSVVKIGETVQVKILKLHPKGGKISLSMRQAEPDPWEGVESRFEPGKKYKGIVRRSVDFGVFVEMTPGLEALAPVREFPPMEGDWTERLAPGNELDWLVLSIDPARRRMSILPAWDDLPEGTVDVTVGAELTGRVQKIERFGVFVWLGPGKVGLMPTAFTGLAPGVRMDSRFQVGQEVAVEVLEISGDGHKIRLAAQGAAAEKAKTEKKEVTRERRDRDGEPGRRGRTGGRGKDRSVTGPMQSSNEGTFGTGLGDLLKAALDRKKEE